MNKQNRTVNLQMNLMSVIAIVAVVCGHEACSVLTVSNLFPYYSWHLPVFVFISGYFYSEKSEQSILQYVIKNAKKLLGYFFFWQFLYAAILTVLNYFCGGLFKLAPTLSIREVFLDPLFSGTSGLTTANWYLVMLFFLLLVNVVLRRCFSLIKGAGKEYIIELFYLVLGFAGCTMAGAGLNHGVFLRITQVFFFLPFFQFGILYRKELEFAIDKIPNSWYYAAVLGVQASLLVLFDKFNAVSAWMTGFEQNPAVYYLYGLNGILLLLRICRNLAPAIGNNPAILYIGRNTRTVMTHHMPVYFSLHFILFLLMPYFPMLSDFDAAKFTSSIYYHYYPGGKNGLAFIYVIMTMAIPLLLRYYGSKVAGHFRDRETSLPKPQILPAQDGKKTAGRNHCIDTIKGIACICVVLIHYNWSNDFSMLLRNLSRFAVPFFFFVSGFYLPDSRGEITGSAVSRKIGHIGKMLCKAAIFYGLFCIYWNSMMDSSWNLWSFTKSKVTTWGIMNMVISGNTLVYAHFWYLLSLFYCYIIIYMVGKKLSRNVSLVAFLVILFAYTLLAEFNKFIGISNFIRVSDSATLVLSNVFLLRSMPFLLWGIYLRKSLEGGQISTARVNPSVVWFVGLLLVVATGCVLVIFEARRFGDILMYAGTHITVLALSCMAVWYPAKRIRCLEYIGNRLSMYVYIYHIAVGKTWDLIATKCHLWGNATFKAFRPLIVIACSLLVAQMIVMTKKQRANRP